MNLWRQPDAEVDATTSEIFASSTTLRVNETFVLLSLLPSEKELNHGGWCVVHGGPTWPGRWRRSGPPTVPSSRVWRSRRRCIRPGHNCSTGRGRWKFLSAWSSLCSLSQSDHSASRNPERNDSHSSLFVWSCDRPRPFGWDSVPVLSGHSLWGQMSRSRRDLRSSCRSESCIPSTW